ncbi:PAS domain S-box protein [Fodinibius sp. Rm-B-1B1-1]|uniref:PAS domain S-box protein n=1 Tax=Fodinibius alkaliphilus TaxID=3140241 RepID=UPI00315A3AA6
MAPLDKGTKILVIEDNKGDFVLIQEYLMEESSGTEIDRVSTFAEAKESIQNDTSYDIILLDLTLPDASGETLVRDIVSLSGDIPVIVLTGYENKEFSLKTLSMGVADYLLKDELNSFLLSKSISYSIERNRINKSLRESEKQYRDLFELSPQPKFVYDIKTLNILDVNRRAIDHYGYSRKEFLSMTIRDIRPKEEIPDLEETLEKSLQTKGIFESGVHTHQKKNGARIKVNIKSTFITFKGQEARIVVADDVTDRLKTERQLALSEQRFKSLVQNGGDLIAILDREANFTYLSQTYVNVLGMHPEDYIGVNAYQFVHPDDRARIQEHVKNLDKNDRVEVAPYRFKNADGEWRWVETTYTSMFDNPAVEGFVANSRDVTEKIERKQKLQDSLELYEYVTKATDDVVYDWDIKKDTFEWDDSFHEKFILDINEDAYSIKDWADHVHPDDLQKTQESLNNFLSSDRSKWEQEYRFKKNDGSYATVFERGFVIRDHSGNAIRMIGSLQDITERKKYEEKLEELALVASKTTDVIFMTDPNERITWVNDAFEKMTGYHFDEVIGKSPGNILTGPENQEQTLSRISKAFKNKKPLQEVVLNYSKTGDKYWFDLTLDPIFDNNGDCDGFIAIQKDVTEQIERQRELSESVERYEIVSKATSDTIWDLDLDKDTIEYNQNIYAMFGYEKQEVEEIGQWWRDKLHPDDRQQVLDTLEKAIENGTERLQLKYRFEAADGTYKHIYDRAFVVSDKNNNAIRVIGAMQDVTQQREEQKWLQLFESAVASTKESIAILEAQPSDLPGREILYVNDAFANMTGYPKDQAKGKTLKILTGPKTSTEEQNKLVQHMDRWESYEAELINYKKSGEEFWVRISMTPVKGPNQTHYWVCVGRDITEQKKHENELRESLKEKETLLLEIHHRVKNNLAVISGMIQLQAYETENKKFSEQLFDSVARIQTMGSIHELLYQSESFSRLNFDENIQKLVSEISNTFQTDFDLTVDYNLQSVDLNINQAIPCSLIINEVITNILKHAFEEGDDGKMTVSVREKSQEVIVTVKDNGKGLPSNFNTMMTNKTLGLKLIDTLAQQLDADYAYNSLSNGTKFSLSFQKSEPKGIGSSHLM